MTHSALISRRHTLALLGAGLAAPVFSQTSPPWAEIERRARGQTVYFNAWAGSQNINAYLQWAGGEVSRRFGVTLEHVKISDAAEVVKRVRAEKAAGKLANGTVDLVWINGENFLTMKREGLLFGSFAQNLPNFAYVDLQGKPTTQLDFSEPTDGMEAPWGMAQLTFFADRKQVPTAPRNMADLLAFVKTHPGRVTYPRLPNFHGSTFVKQALLELNPGSRELCTRPTRPRPLPGPPDRCGRIWMSYTRTCGAQANSLRKTPVPCGR